MRIKLAFGREGLWIDLPDRANTTVIEPRFVPGLTKEGEKQAIQAALRSPLGDSAAKRADFGRKIKGACSLGRCCLQRSYPAYAQ